MPGSTKLFSLVTKNYITIKAWGLNYNLSYDNQKDLDTLRYGNLVIMADQDVDGSHIKGLSLKFGSKLGPDSRSKTTIFGTFTALKSPSFFNSQKGLILNFVQNYWPALVDRVSQFTTPIIIARKKKQKVEFYSEADFEKWFNSQARLRNFAD